MADIGAGVKPDSPLAKLAGNTLTTIATPPGRIYDKHELTVLSHEGVEAIHRGSS